MDDEKLFAISIHCDDGGDTHYTDIPSVGVYRSKVRAEYAVNTMLNDELRNLGREYRRDGNTIVRKADGLVVSEYRIHETQVDKL